MMSPESASPSRAGSLALVGNALALDFANTSSGRGTDRRLEHFQDAAHVVAWAAHAGVVAAQAADEALALIAEGDPAFDALLPRAVVLREAIHRIFAALADGRPADQADLHRLTAAHRETLAFADLEMDGQICRWSWNAPGAAEILGPIALSAVDLLRREASGRIKQCPGAACGWLFLDTSRNRSRRWCEMEVCGNRAKSHRHRIRGAADPAAGET